MPPEITKEDFDRYEAVRESGKYNMIMDAQHAMIEAGMLRWMYLDILRNYHHYKEKFYGKEE